MTAIEPFEVAYPPEAIADLRDRLVRTRWPEKETVDDWSQGVPLAFARELCAHWADAYDFAAAQARLNAFPQFRTSIDGLGMHFLHVRSPHEGALPLILTHGWPGSVVEFLDVIEPLTNPPDPADAFHVVVPSLPGYGFSDRPAATGWKVERIARAWDELMGRLGYDQYGAQGGDWGAMVTTSIGQQFAGGRCAGIHLNMALVPLHDLASDDLTPAEQSALASLQEHGATGTGYSTQQSTRPQTLGYGLTDSPAGQCAWIAEKFWAWTDCGGDPEKALTKDQMLDNISVYWFTATATSSARLYWESFDMSHAEPVTVPTGISVFPGEVFRISKRWAERRFSDIRWYDSPAAGGHFAAFEQPALFVDEVRGFFRTVR